MTRRYLAEFFATFILVFAGTGAIVVNDVRPGAVTHVGIALTFGLVVMVLIYALGHVSGAHMNPAVSVAMLLQKKLTRRSCAGYVLFQLLGALAASALLASAFPKHATLGATLPFGPHGVSWVFEFLLTMILLIVIGGTTRGPVEWRPFVGMAVGGTVGLEAMFAGPITGASMNPARSLAPAVVSGHTADLWIYLTAPFAGAIAGLLVSVILFPHSESARIMSFKTILFVCVENSNRSQMAEAFARMHAGPGIIAASSGSRPSGKVNPRAIEFMAERGYDLTSHTSKSLDQFNGQEIEVAVTMGCGDECPLVKAKRREEWQIPDPKELPAEDYRKVRDFIETKVQALLATLKDDDGK